MTGCTRHFTALPEEMPGLKSLSCHSLDVVGLVPSSATAGHKNAYDAALEPFLVCATLFSV